MVPSSFDLLRWTLLGALGASLVSCGGETDDGGGDSGGAGGRPGQGSGTGGGAGAGSTGSGGLGAEVSNCTNPVEQGGGFVSCEEGFVHRPNGGVCPDGTPRSEPVTDAATVPDAPCYSDADCSGALEYCALYSGFGVGTACVTGCLSDADCGAGFICQCGSPLGGCVSAGCTTDADCQDGLLCTPWTADDGCGPTTTYACQTSGDQCQSASDCEAGEECRPNAAGVRACQPREYLCASGRPFVVGEVQRLAPVERRRDWLAGAERPEQDWQPIGEAARSLPPSRRFLVSEHYARAGQMEHASIAAFARFALELLALGAPVDLLERTNVAQMDETRHARLCFRLAEIYGAPIGPGPLDVSGPVVGASLREIARTAVVEGCIGETVAALEAREAARASTCPALTLILTSIAEDEERHAELAYRFVRFAIEQDSAIGAVLLPELERALADVPSTEHSRSDSLEDHGVLSSEVMAIVRRRALEEVVRPAFDALRRAVPVGFEPARAAAGPLL